MLVCYLHGVYVCENIYIVSYIAQIISYTSHLANLAIILFYFCVEKIYTYALYMKIQKKNEDYQSNILKAYQKYFVLNNNHMFLFKNWFAKE